MIKKLDYQQLIDSIRDQYRIDFISLAFVQSAKLDYVLKWQYASGNINNRYKRVVLQSGKGIAGSVFKSGKPLYIDDISTSIAKDDLFNYPIVIAEELISLAAFPIYENETEMVKGVILFGFRTKTNVNDACYNEIYHSFLNKCAKDRNPGVIS